jgi:hypothetical protein
MPMCLSNAQDDRIVIAYAGVSVELTSHVVKNHLRDLPTLDWVSLLTKITYYFAKR